MTSSSWAPARNLPFGRRPEDADPRVRQGCGGRAPRAGVAPAEPDPLVETADVPFGRCCRGMFRMVVGAGVLLGMLSVGLLVTAYLWPGPLLVLPAAAALLAVVVVTVRGRGDAGRPGRRPVDDDTVRTALEVRAAARPVDGWVGSR